MLTTLFLRARRPLDPVRVYSAYAAAFAFCYALTATLSLVFMATTLRLNPLQMVVVGTVLEGVTFAFEIPTGVVADRYSRRVSVLIGVAVVGAGFLLQGLATGFATVLLAQLVWGAGFTFISGSDEAWLADEIGAERVGPVFTRAQQLELGATIAGTLAAGALGLLSLRLPLLMSGAGLVVLSAGLALTMTEHGLTRTPPADRESIRGFARSVRDGLAAARRGPVVRGLLVVSLLAGLSEEAVDRLWTLHLLRDHPLPDLPGGTVVLFSGITLAGTVIALLASLAVNRVSPDRLGAAHPNAALAVLAAVQVAGIAGLALAGGLWFALAGLWARTAAVAVAAPVRSAWLNRNLDPATRATALSVNSQANAIGQVAGGPPLGVLGNRAGILVAMVVSAVVLAPTIALYAWMRRRPEGGPGSARR